jgi:hypothetical protein
MAHNKDQLQALLNMVNEPWGFIYGRDYSVERLLASQEELCSMVSFR